MPKQRGYRQACGVARALDFVGERWALLVVRELLLGPKRFTDLQRALPTASPNALTDRLRELTDVDILRRRRLGNPERSQVYELTDWGRGLEPIVVALGTWALEAPPTAEQLFVSPDSAMLTIRSYYVPSSEGESTLEIELTDHGAAGQFGVSLSPAGAEVSHGPPEAPDATVVTTTQSLLAAFDRRSIQPLLDTGTVIKGDLAAVRRLVTGMHVPG